MTRTEDHLAGPRGRLLLVDDQPANLRALAAMLAGLEADCVQAMSGAEALRLLAGQDFAIVLLSVPMRDLDAFAMARQVRSHERSGPTPIIFLATAANAPFSAKEAYTLGAVDYLVRPLEPIIVRAKVAGFLELFQKTEQIKRQAEQLRQHDRREFEQRLAAENERLLQSESRKAAILETALDAIISIDHEGTIIEFNPAAEKTFGYSRAQALGRPLAELIIPPALRERHFQGLARHLATGQPLILNQRIEMPALRADGSEFLAELAITAIRTSGSPVFTAYLRDITDRKRRDQRRAARLEITQVLAEAASLAEATPRILQAVCDSLAWDVGALWIVDPEAGRLRCVEVWQRQVQVPEFEALTRCSQFAPGVGLPGRVWTSRKPAWIHDVVEDPNFPRAAIVAREGLHGAFGFPILLGQECLGAIEFFSRQIREPDPDLLEMMATIGSQIGQFMDRRRAEESLRASEQRFTRFMHHLPGLAWIKDLQGRYIYANEAATRAFGCSLPALLGKTDEDLFPPETAALFRANDRTAAASEVGIQAVETLTHPDGTMHHSLVSKFPIPGPDGRTALVGGMAVDVTDRLRAEEALKEEGRRKDEFLAMLAHELRNPLAPIRNALHVMKQPAAGRVAVEQVRDMAERQVQHMARLLDDLLDVSRISRGRIELRKEAVDVAVVITRTVEAVRPLIEERRHELTVSLPGGPLRVEADPTRLEQVLTNLLNNSAKYTDPGGRITLSAGREGDEAVLRVKDTGIGIASDMLPKVFDLFVQAERRLDRAQGGVGIGLTLVKKLVELHGGRIEAFSGGPGCGSEFVVHLPLLAEPAASERDQADGTMDAVALPRHLILVVDDNPDAADSLALLLRLSGQEVRAAYDGPAALRLAQEFQPTMVFLDIGMPMMDGYEVARRLRTVAGLEGTVLVALTGWGQAEDQLRSRQAGFDHHLVKPVELDVLRRVLAGPKVAK